MSWLFSTSDSAISAKGVVNVLANRRGEEESIHNNVLELLGTSSEVATVDRVIAQLQGLDLMKITLISDITNVTEEST